MARTRSLTRKQTKGGKALSRTPVRPKGGKRYGSHRRRPRNPRNDEMITTGGKKIRSAKSHRRRQTKGGRVAFPETFFGGTSLGYEPVGVAGGVEYSSVAPDAEEVLRPSGSEPTF